MCSEGYGIVIVSVCVCVCKSHLTSEASVHPENAVMHSAGNEGQNICGVFSENAPLQRLSTPSLGWPYIRSAIFLQITRMRIVHTEVRNVMFELHAISSPCILYSFAIIILGLESSG